MCLCCLAQSGRNRSCQEVAPLLLPVCAHARWMRLPVRRQRKGFWTQLPGDNKAMGDQCFWCFLKAVADTTQHIWMCASEAECSVPVFNSILLFFHVEMCFHFHKRLFYSHYCPHDVCGLASWMKCSSAGMCVVGLHFPSRRIHYNGYLTTDTVCNKEKSLNMENAAKP